MCALFFIWFDVIDDWYCACCKHAGKLDPYAGICCYLITENNYIGPRPTKINNFIDTSLQNMANVTSAVDISIDNNDNDFR